MDIIKKYQQGKNVKYIFELADSSYIEAAVFIHQNGLHYCVPTQVGCPLKCNHCSTTYTEVPYIRQIKLLEMIAMLEKMLNDTEEQGLSQILSFSGHGEPMLNWNTVSNVMGHFGDTFSAYYITSVGITSVFEEILQSNHLPEIYLSIHGSDDEERGKIIRLDENPMIANFEQILEFGKLYTQKGGRIVWNYIVCPYNSSEQSKSRLEILGKNIDYPLEIRFMKYIDIGIKNGMGVLSDDVISEMVAVVQKIKNPYFRARKSYLEGSDMGIACGQLRAHTEYFRAKMAGSEDY